MVSYFLICPSTLLKMIFKGYALYGESEILTCVSWKYVNTKICLLVVADWWSALACKTASCKFVNILEKEL